MTKLIVKPLDMAEPGSFRQRSRLFRAIKQSQEAQKTGNAVAAIDAFLSVEDLVLPRMTTDDADCTVDEILDKLTGNEFDVLLLALAGQGAETVPPAKASS